MSACQWGHTDIASMLIKKGAVVNVTRKNKKDGRTALIEAARGKYTQIVSLLLDNEANVNAKDAHGQTALIWASVEGHIDIVSILLDNGANVNTKDNRGDTSLILASKKGFARIVEILLERGADVNAVNTRGYTVSHKPSCLHLLQKYYWTMELMQISQI